MNVMVVGGGAREHSIAWKLAQSPEAERIFAGPRNPGMEEVAENVPIAANEVDKWISFAKQNKVGMTVVALDNLLANGIVDEFQDAGLTIFGPTKQAAQIEASKVFAKGIMAESGVPTADFAEFTSVKDARAYARDQRYPLFIKADGPALGKGAVRADSAGQAEQIIKDMMVHKKFGAAGERILIESFLDGQEASLHAFCDGKTYRMMPISQDYKSVYEGGKNTGGMGAVAPLYLPETLESLGERFIAPVMNALNKHGFPFIGNLYAGIKGIEFTKKVVEYNARIGDPEAQVYMRLLKSDLLRIMMACVEGNLDEVDIEWSDEYAVGVVLASEGYPEAQAYESYPISGIDKAQKMKGVEVFQAGTRRTGQGDGIETAGGRVLTVTATSETYLDAKGRANHAADKITFMGRHFRPDIGDKAIPYSYKR